MSTVKTYYRGWKIEAAETNVTAQQIGSDEEFIARGFSDQKQAMEFGKRAVDRRLETKGQNNE